MFGAVIKSYFAEKNNIDPEKIYVVSVMPCVAKKFENSRPEMEANGLRDVDAVITTRELAKMIKEQGILFDKLPDEMFDQPFGEASGAAHIFGATGGVMEAALRTVYEILENKELDKLDFEAVRGTEGIKEATVNMGGMDVNVAIAHGLGNARKLLDSIKSGEKTYHFIEVMACPGGCVTGGGQPICDAKTWMTVDVKKERAKALYKEDMNATVRQSHKNPDMDILYKEFFEKPGSHKAHELLHTHYTKRDMF